jgi:hypothetical protein
VNSLPDRHAQFVIIQWITCVIPKLANLLMHSQCVCTCQKLKFSFLLLEYCKIRECYAVANAFTIRNMYSLFLYMKCNSRKINRPKFENLLPDRHAKFVIIQWITCVVPKLANLLMHSQCALRTDLLKHH